MITSKEARKSFNTLVGGEELKEIIEYPPNGNWHKLYLDVERYITQQEELTTKVKRYFEISSGNIGDNLDEYRRLEKEINEMVGIEE